MALKFLIPLGISLASSVLQKLLTPKPKTAEIKDPGFSQSSYGAAIPRIYGFHRTSCPEIWRKPIKDSVKKSGKGGSFKGSNQRLYGSWASLIADRPGQLIKILANGEVVLDYLKESEGDTTWRDTNRKFEKFFTFYDGNQIVQDPTIVAREGISRVPTWQGFSYIVFAGLNCEQFGNRIPSIDVMFYSTVGTQTTGTSGATTYSNPGYATALYSLELKVINNLNVVKTLTVNNIQGPIIGAEIRYTTDVNDPFFVDRIGTVWILTVGGAVSTPITGIEWGKRYTTNDPNTARFSGIGGSVQIQKYFINGVQITSNYTSTDIRLAGVATSSKIVDIQPQKVKDLLRELVAEANESNPFLRARLNLSGVPDTLMFSGYKTSGNFDVLSVLMEIVKTYSLYLTYVNAEPALFSQIEPEYFQLHTSDFISDPAAPLYSIEYVDLRQTPRELIFKYSNAEQDLQDDVVIARVATTDFNGGLVEESTAFSLKHATAKALAQTQLCQTVSRGAEYSFRLHPRRRDVTIGTLLYFREFGNILKCDEVKYGFDFSVEVKATVYNPILDQLSPIYVNDLNGTTTASGSTSTISAPNAEGRIVAKNIPIFNSSKLDNSIYVALIAEASYRSGEVRTSFDAGASYTSDFTVTSPSGYGTLVTQLEPHTHLLEDTINNCTVKLDTGELYSQTLKAYNTYEVMLLLNKEIICYRYATLTGGGYELRNLQRGLYGTERYIQTHPIGTEVFLLNGLKRVADDLANIDRDRIAILVDIDQIASDSAPVDATNNGESIRPYNPYIWNVSREGSGIRIDWAPRDRLQPSMVNNFVTQTDPDNYRLKIGATRVVNTTNRTYLYTSSQQTTDGFTGNVVTLDLIHIGAQSIDSLPQPEGYPIY